MRVTKCDRCHAGMQATAPERRRELTTDTGEKLVVLFTIHRLEWYDASRGDFCGPCGQKLFDLASRDGVDVS